MKQITINVDDDQYRMIQSAAKRRNKTIRALILRIFYDLDYQDHKEHRKNKRGDVQH